MQGISTNCKKITEKYQKNIKHETQNNLNYSGGDNRSRQICVSFLQKFIFDFILDTLWHDLSPPPILTAKNIHK